MKYKYIKEYLKNILGDNYYVTNERNLEFQNGKINVIINSLSTTEFDGVSLLPVQMVFFSNDIDETQDALDDFVNTYNRKTWNIGSEYVRSEYSKAQCIDKNVPDISLNSPVRFLIYATFLVYSDINRLDSITIDGVEHKVFTYNLTYEPSDQAGEEFEQNTNGPNAIKHIYSFTANNISLVLYSKNTDFLNTALDIQMGDTSPNTVFEVTFNFSNGTSYTREMLVGTYSNLTTSENDIPKVQVTLAPASRLLY